MRILFASRNPSKIALFRPVFAAYDLAMTSLRDEPHLASAEEEGRTVVENALNKARLHHGPAHPWTFGDDAALEIDALGGEPGVQARRWGGLLPASISDEEWLDYLLARLEDVPPERRTAAGWPGGRSLRPTGPRTSTRSSPRSVSPPGRSGPSRRAGRCPPCGSARTTT